MAGSNTDILSAAQVGFAEQDSELAAARSRQMLGVESQRASGSGDINHVFSLDLRFRLVFVRCHYVGGAGASPLTISVDSGGGSAFDTRLFTLAQAGTGRDVNFRITGEEAVEPSAWTFQSGDKVRMAWVNPDGGSMSWGLEIGLALAS